MSYPQIPDSKFLSFSNDLINMMSSAKIAADAATAASSAATTAANLAIASDDKYEVASASATVTLSTPGIINASAPTANVVLTLPDVAAAAGKVFIVVRADATGNTIQVRPAVGQAFRLTGTAVTLAATEFVHLVSSGTHWVVLGGKAAA